MSNKSALFGAFIAGAAIGSAITYKFVKDKYEKLSKAESESFMARLRELHVSDGAERPVAKATNKTGDESTDDGVKKSYEKLVSHLGYTDYAAKSVRRVNTYEPPAETDQTPVKENVECPEIIDPEEIGEYSDYRVLSLMYFSDHVLADHDGNIISSEESDELLGPNALDSFGQYEEDAVHVRNDSRKCYYEVIMDGRMYADFIRKRPYLLKDDDEEEEED